jgi:hypothetical protein
MKVAPGSYPRSKRPRPIGADPVQGLGPGRYDGSETLGGVLPKSSAYGRPTQAKDWAFAVC